MNKEKELEEMAEFIAANKYVRDAYEIAIGLQNMGYRKADEVRKETAKEIWNRLFQKADNTWNNRLNLSKQDIRSFATQDGIEVDE